MDDQSPEAWAYMTFQIRLSIQNTSSDPISIYTDFSYVNYTKDLRQSGKKIVLLSIIGVEVDSAVAKNYTKIDQVDPLVKL